MAQITPFGKTLHSERMEYFKKIFGIFWPKVEARSLLKISVYTREWRFERLEKIASKKFKAIFVTFELLIFKQFYPFLR